MQRVAAAVLACLGSAWLFAQEAKQAFRSGVELVQLDVSVLDADRRPVRGLTAADFTVLENGEPRPIRTFSAIDIPTRDAAPQPVWSKEAPADVSTNQIADAEGRLLVILMDRSIPRNGISLEAQKVAVAAVDALGPRDLAALVSTSGVYTPQNFTSNRERLVKAIMQRDWSTESSIAPWRLDDATDARCFCGLCVLEAVTRISDALRNTPQRRKILLFIGQGITLNLTNQALSASAGCESRVKPAREKLFASLEVSGLTVHSIDPKGLFTIGEHTTASTGGGMDRPGLTAPQVRLNALGAARSENLRNQESLAVLPDRTGGRRVINTNGLTEKAAEIVRESDAYYVLGFERDPSAPLDTRRSLSVKVARKNVRAFAQRAFVTPGREPARTAAGAASSDDALTGLLPLGRRPLGLNLAAFAGGSGQRASVRVTLNAASFAATGRATLDIRAVAFDQAGKEVAAAAQTSTLGGTLPSTEGAAVVDLSTHLDLDPGDYEIRVSAVEQATGTTASVFGQIVVPKFATEPLSLSDVAVERGTVSAGTIAPTTGRAFARADQVRAFFQVYQGTRRTDAIRPVTVRVRILDASGTLARDQSMVLDSTQFRERSADCRINVPVGGLEPGAYLLQIDATANDATVARKLPFAVR